MMDACIYIEPIGWGEFKNGGFTNSVFDETAEFLVIEVGHERLRLPINELRRAILGENNP